MIFMASSNIASRKKPKHMLFYLTLAVIVVIVLAAISTLKISGIVNISQSGSNITIGYKPTIIEVMGSEYAVSLASAPSNGHAYVYIEDMPALIKPAALVYLSLSNATKVNTYGNYTTIEMRLDSISNASAAITVKPVSATLEIAPDSSSIKFISWNLNATSQKIRIVTNVTTNATNTNTTKVTTATTSITTIPQVNITAQNITSLLNNDTYYKLMLNYVALYQNTTHCTSSLYNSTYLAVYNTLPTPQFSYENISSFIPYNMTIKKVNDGNGIYTINFVEFTRMQEFNNKDALSIVLNANKYLILNNTLGGVYQGDNYTILLNGYNKATTIGGSCGIYVAH
jgi:hypothetical protein